MSELLFEVLTPVGLKVRCTREYWDFIIKQKHPVLAGRQRQVEEALASPDEVRRSRKDERVMMFYKGGPPRWTCAVVRRENGDAFLITAYPTDKVKMGEPLWTRSK